MKQLRSQLMSSRAYLEGRLKGERVLKPHDLLVNNEQLGAAVCLLPIAAGLRYGHHRQRSAAGYPAPRALLRRTAGAHRRAPESTRHTEAIAELTRYLGLGDYESWSEADKQAFLIRELNSKRPLVPLKWQPSADTQEVLETCRVIAEAPQGSIAAYVISMARTPSDVLAVHLLLKEAGCPFALPVAPLFETLDDLNNADDVMTQLLNIDWYRGFIQGKQMVMIGYSDSAKDAGVMAASPAQYRAQDALIKTCEKPAWR